MHVSRPFKRNLTKKHFVCECVFETHHPFENVVSMPLPVSAAKHHNTWAACFPTEAESKGKTKQSRQSFHSVSNEVPNNIHPKLLSSFYGRLGQLRKSHDDA